MRVTRFPPDGELMIVRGRLWGPTGRAIDGLLELSFLRRLRYTVRSDEGRIPAERIDGA